MINMYLGFYKVRKTSWPTGFQTGFPTGTRQGNGKEVLIEILNLAAALGAGNIYKKFNLCQGI